MLNAERFKKEILENSNVVSDFSMSKDKHAIKKCLGVCEDCFFHDLGDHCFMGRRISLDSYEYYQKNRKRYGNAIVTNISLNYKISEPHILIEAETTMGRWTKKEGVK